MLIGNRYSDNKLYRGIKHYDSLPLTSGDLHEYADILQMKNAFFMNNIIGSGTLNEPICVISSAGISLSSPSVVLIDGDISLVQSTSILVPTSQIASAGFSDGIAYMVGWYQAIDSSSTIRAYGGVENSILQNDLIDSTLGIQVSTRYQLRWVILVGDCAAFMSGESIQLSIPNRDGAGNLTSGTSNVTIGASTNTVRTATKPASMTYAVSDLYIIPILKYHYGNSTISSAVATPAIHPIGTNNFISSTTEPTGRYTEGTIWYNPITYKFKFYVPDVGFVATASDIALTQYNNTITISTATTTPSNITIPIGINNYEENDILQVIYNGVVLSIGEHYVLDSANATITLLGFTTEVGDSITFVTVKLIDTSSATTIASAFNTHVAITGNSTVKGHVTLSDAANSSLGVERGVAITPKALYNATTIIDSVTSKRYRLTVTNGVLGISEV